MEGEEGRVVSEGGREVEGRGCPQSGPPLPADNLPTGCTRPTSISIWKSPQLPVDVEHSPLSKEHSILGGAVLPIVGSRPAGAFPVSGHVEALT